MSAISDEKNCPMCGATIKAVARKCRFCGEMLEVDGSLLDRDVIEREAKRLLRVKQDKTTSWQLLVTGILGCFSPILAIYGAVFLLRRSYAFPGKGLAIAGTILHCVWTVMLVALFAIGAFSEM